MSAKSGSAVYIDLSVLTQIVGANQALRERLLGAFVTEALQNQRKIEDALDANAFDAARAAAHHLSGSARMVGARSLADTARGLEAAEVYDDAERITHLRAELARQVAAVCERIRAEA